MKGIKMKASTRLIISTILLLMFVTPFVMYSFSGLGTLENQVVEIQIPIVASNDHSEMQTSDSVEMKNRLETIKNFCQKYHLGKSAYSDGRTNDLRVKDPPSPQYSYFFLNKERGISWCPVYKAGSTSWLHNMMLLAGYSEADLAHPPKQLSIWAREVYGEPEPGKIFDEAFKILIVRHPFERILSAYRDKLSNSTIGLEHGTLHFYTKYGKPIVTKFRTNSSITQLEPTFQEFVRYLIATDLVLHADDHWLPAYYSCTPCHVQYDAVGKLETYSRDQAYIIRLTNLSSIMKPKWKHSTSPNSDKHQEHSSKYFSQLTRSQIQALYQKYWLDFNMFNYSYSEYLEYGRLVP